MRRFLGMLAVASVSLGLAFGCGFNHGKKKFAFSGTTHVEINNKKELMWPVPELEKRNGATASMTVVGKITEVSYEPKDKGFTAEKKDDTTILFTVTKASDTVDKYTVTVKGKGEDGNDDTLTTTITWKKENIDEPKKFDPKKEDAKK